MHDKRPGSVMHDVEIRSALEIKLSGTGTRAELDREPQAAVASQDYPASVTQLKCGALTLRCRDLTHPDRWNCYGWSGAHQPNATDDAYQRRSGSQRDSPTVVCNEHSGDTQRSSLASADTCGWLIRPGAVHGHFSCSRYLHAPGNPLPHDRGFFPCLRRRLF